MPKVTISNSKGLVEEPGGGLTVESTSALVGATTITGALVANSTSNDIALSLRVVIGDKVTLDTGAETTVSGAVVQPANTVLMGVGMMCTQAFTIGSGANMGLNVGTADDGSDSSIVALDADAIYSSATAGMAANAFLTSFNGGPTAEAGTAANGAGLSLVANAAVFTTSDRNLYFQTTSDSGYPTAGKYKPILFVMRLA